MRTFSAAKAALLMVLVFIWTGAANATPIRAGALGDSLGDEYVFTGKGAARGYVELLAAYRGIDFGAYSPASRGEPRLEGFANNWANALSKPGGVLTSDLIPTGQVPGLLGQANANQVDVAFITVGGNDFRSIFGGADPLAVITNGLTNELTSIQTLLTNPNLKIVVANVPDITLIPEAQLTLLNAPPAQKPFIAGAFAQVSGAIDLYNAQLAAALAGNNRVAIADINTVFKDIINNPVVDGHILDTLNPGDTPDHFFVDTIHPGTIGQGLLANSFIDALDSKFGYSIPEFTPRELLAAAAAPAPVPLPAGLWMGMLAVPLIWLRMRAHSRRVA